MKKIKQSVLIFKNFVDNTKSWTKNAYASLELVTDNLLYVNESGEVEMSASIEGTLISVNIVVYAYVNFCLRSF